jgi:pimeloyl-ACP methyl ester carboxylesterase
MEIGIFSQLNNKLFGGFLFRSKQRGYFKMKMLDRWVDNKGVNIHYLDNESQALLTPLVYVPGMLGTAEQFTDEMEVLRPRRCISMSLRGRGKSDIPKNGYSLIDHASDIKAVIKNCKLQEYIVMAYSMGVPYALECASQHSMSIKALILLDYPARLPQISQDWKTNIVNRFGTWTEPFAEAIQNESVELELWDRLEKINCPILVIRGGKDGARINEEYAKKYEESVNEKLTLIEFTESGHELWEPSYDRFISTIKEFINNVDNM